MFGQVLTKAFNDLHMVDRPGFYSGRGATRSDLNSRILEGLHSAILKGIGADAASAFVSMVAEMPSLPATDFLLTLARLEGAGWKWSKDLLGAERGVYPDCNASALATVVEILGGSRDRDDTAEIRGEFLRAHGKGAAGGGDRPYPLHDVFDEFGPYRHRATRAGRRG